MNALVAVRLRPTTKASSAPSPSSTRASATEMPTGGAATVADVAPSNWRPSGVSTAPAGNVIVTAPNESGSTSIAAVKEKRHRSLDRG